MWEQDRIDNHLDLLQKELEEVKELLEQLQRTS